MKRIAYPFFMLLLAVAFMASCVKGEGTEFEGYDDTAIVGFSITQATVTKYTKTKAGDKDSVYFQKITPTKIQFSINQLENTIYNNEALPYGTNAKKLLGNFTTRYGGIVYLKDLKTNNPVYYNSTDTLDLSSEREVLVYSSNGTYKRSYKLKLNVQVAQPDSFQWKDALTSDANLASLTGMRMVNFSGKMFVFGVNGNSVKAYSTATNDGKAWTAISPNITFDANFAQNVVKKGNTLFSINGTTLYKSSDAVTWTAVGSPSVTRLFATDSNNLYGLNASNEVLRSGDNGVTWNVETLDDNKSNFPNKDVFGFESKIESTPTLSSLVVVGNLSNNIGDGTQKQVTWSKVVDSSNGALNNAWSFYGLSSNSNSRLPELVNMQVAQYGQLLLATGAETLAGTNNKQVQRLYVSKDWGVTWSKSTDIQLVNLAANATAQAAMAVDADNYLWLVYGTTGKVYKGIQGRFVK